MFSHAVSLIICPTYVNNLNLVLSNKLFIRFIEDGIQYYGSAFPIYNVHSLSHIVNLNNLLIDFFSVLDVWIIFRHFHLKII